MQFDLLESKVYTLINSLSENFQERKLMYGYTAWIPASWLLGISSDVATA